VRQETYHLKISGEQWLEIARTVHRAGLRSNCTMLHGHIETVEERVDHLDRLLEKGCREQPKTEFALKSCHALGDARACQLEMRGVLTHDGDISQRANLAVIVAGPPGDDPQVGQGELLAIMAQAMDSLSGGVVVAGPIAAAGDNGYVTAVRDSDASDSVSTVDVADRPSGQIVTVMALAQQADGAVGQYGAADSADAVMPEPAQQ